MTFALKLRELEAKATEGPLSVIDLRPKQDRLTITDGVSVVCRIENRISGKPLNDEDVANAKLIAHLRNHAKEIIALVDAAEELVKCPSDQQIEDMSLREIKAWESINEALAALNKEQS